MIETIVVLDVLRKQLVRLGNVPTIILRGFSMGRWIENFNVMSVTSDSAVGYVLNLEQLYNDKRYIVPDSIDIINTGGHYKISL